MRTTVRLDDDLLEEVKRRAQREKVSIAQVMNRALREGLRAKSGKKRPFRQKTHDLGRPLVNLDKALALAGALDDERLLARLGRQQ